MSPRPSPALAVGDAIHCSKELVSGTFLNTTYFPPLDDILTAQDQEAIGKTLADHD